MTPDPTDLRREILRALYQRRAAALTAGYLSTILSRKTVRSLYDPTAGSGGK